MKTNSVTTILNRYKEKIETAKLQVTLLENKISLLKEIQTEISFEERLNIPTLTTVQLKSLDANYFASLCPDSVKPLSVRDYTSKTSLESDRITQALNAIRIKNEEFAVNRACGVYPMDF